jgi:hypothetical protein
MGITLAWQQKPVAHFSILTPTQPCVVSRVKTTWGLVKAHSSKALMLNIERLGSKYGKQSLNWLEAV